METWKTNTKSQYVDKYLNVFKDKCLNKTKHIEFYNGGRSKSMTSLAQRMNYGHWISIVS